MKTKILALIALLCVVIFPSCDKDEESNSLDGTKWVAKYVDYYAILEFSGSNTTAYFADENLIMDTSAYTSNYTMSGDNISFDNLVVVNWYDYKFESAKMVSATAMIVSYRYRFGDKEWSDIMTFDFQKQ